MGFFFIVHVIVCVLLVAVILFQEGKAGGLTSVSDSSQSVFGARGAASFLTKLTSGLAICFMVTSLGLNFIGGSKQKSIADDYQPPVETSDVEKTSLQPTENSNENTSAEGEETPAAEGDAIAEPAKDATETPAESDENDGGDK